MPYSIRFTDFQNKGEILVEDGTINSDTSLAIPGKGATGYGKSIAENFLHLLENFAGSNEPTNPVEGQLWYDTSGSDDQLRVYDATQWRTASGFTKSGTQPADAQSSAGDLWVDTNNQQLFVYTGNSWTLIGPEFGSGLLTGGQAEKIIDINNIERQIFNIKINDESFLILSGVDFTPKAKIPGFTTIKQGLNLKNDNPLQANNPIKFVGVAESAKALTVETGSGSENIAAENFIRKDAPGVIDEIFKVKTNAGMNVGLDDQFALLVNKNSIELRNNLNVSSIDVVLRDQNAFNTVLRVKSDKRVGINNLAPTAALDVVGNTKISPSTDNPDTGKLSITNTNEEDSFSTLGGAEVAKNLSVGQNLSVTGQSEFTGNLVPLQGVRPDIGNVIDVFGSVYAESFVGNLQGDVTGRLTGIAEFSNQLTNSTTFSVTGDVESDSFDFDGATGGNTKTFNLAIKNSFIANKQQISSVDNSDEVLINKVTGNTGVFKVSKFDFLKSVPVTPIGALMPYAGQTAPPGWILCDGSIVLKSDYNDLWQVVGHAFLDPTALPDGGALSFALPDMRGRFPLGVDSMGGVPANRVSSSVSRFLNVRGANTIGTGFNAVFNVQSFAGTYSVQIAEPGQAYQINDKIVISGNVLGGASPTHDLTITITSVTNGGITNFTFEGAAFQGEGPDRIGANSGNQNSNIEVKNLPEHEHDLQGDESQFYAISQRPQDPNNPAQLQTDGDAIPLALEPGATGFQGVPATGGVGGSTTLGVPLDVMNPYLALNYIIYAGV